MRLTSWRYYRAIQHAPGFRPNPFAALGLGSFKAGIGDGPRVQLWLWAASGI